MYKCEDCGKIFEHPKAVQEDRGEFWGLPAFETMYYCPGCGSECFDEYNEEEELEGWDFFKKMKEENNEYVIEWAGKERLTKKEFKKIKEHLYSVARNIEQYRGYASAIVGNIIIEVETWRERNKEFGTIYITRNYEADECYIKDYCHVI